MTDDHIDVSIDREPGKEANKALRIVLSLAVGAIVGIVFHYSLYRMANPIEPFIYQSF